jgi:putative transport protein
MIALGYGVTYIWGTVGIILICKYLPRWWGVDAKKAAREYEAAHGVQNVDDAGAHRLPRRRPACLPRREQDHDRPDHRRVPAASTRSTASRTSCAATKARRRSAHQVPAGDVVALGGKLDD